MLLLAKHGKLHTERKKPLSVNKDLR